MRMAVFGLSALAAVIGLASGGASASTIVTNDGQVSGTGTLLATPGITYAGIPPIVTGQNPTTSGFDPWGAADTTSTWVGSCCNGASANATFNFAAPETTVTFLWGSPNPDNTVTLKNGTTTVGTVSVDSSGNAIVNSVPGGPFLGPNTTAAGDLITLSLSSGTFTSLVLTNSLGGFEVSDFSVSAVPLPSTWVMLLAGLIGLGFFTTRRGSRNSYSAISA
jgi:hypothetical protein